MTSSHGIKRLVSTHSRPKAAAPVLHNGEIPANVSTHSRPKAAATLHLAWGSGEAVSTHSRPKAAAPVQCYIAKEQWRFNSQPPEGGCLSR